MESEEFTLEDCLDALTHSIPDTFTKALRRMYVFTACTTACMGMYMYVAHYVAVYSVMLMILVNL